MECNDDNSAILKATSSQRLQCDLVLNHHGNEALQLYLVADLVLLLINPNFPEIIRRRTSIIFVSVDAVIEFLLFLMSMIWIKFKQEKLPSLQS